MRKNRFKALLIILTGWLGVSLSAPAAESDRLRIVYFDLPPFIVLHDGKPSGNGVPLINRAIKGIPVDPEWQFLPIKRLTYLMATDPIIVFGIGRTPEREAMGLIWIRKLWESHYVFASLAIRGPVDTLEQGKALAHVTCTVGSAPEALLRAEGFDNLETAMSAQQNVSKLAAGHADAWFDMDASIAAHWRLSGQDPSMLTLGRPIRAMETWVAASPKVAPAIVAQLRKNLAALDQGEFEAAHEMK